MPSAPTIPAAIAEITAVTKFASGNVKTLTFADGNTLFFGDDPNSIFEYYNPLQNADVAKQLMIAWWAARSPEFTNTNLVIGKRLTFDLSAANPIKVQ
jgi:hypothetical protein